ncbi:MAG: RloB family protein [Prevotella fusca]|uniref:RloB family protein n=1 Tax=Prevotella fusca TaxID=589436 RepID=UPI003FA1306A
MDFSKLTYKKGESEETLEKPVQHEEEVEQSNVEENETVSVDTPSALPLGYQKGDSFRTPSLVLIISGGEKREKDFLKELINGQKISALKVLFFTEERQGLQPYQMQEKWQSICDAGEFVLNNLSHHLDKMDEVFLLSDVDEFYEQLQKILSSKPAADRGNWIISNPCFEIWLYYCYKNDPTHDLACIEPLTVVERSKRLKKVCNEIVKGGLHGQYAFEHLQEGVEHSREHYREDNNDIPVLFATQMHRLAQFIIDRMNANANEYDAYLKQQQINLEEIRKKSEV